ncbi:hypothetical protein B0H14DRAFT_3179261 [Mycena olivaceomarginata]|nr:hypothetical protein B0H14DRAFT_3179261 [Mycena olivaceomarginata]
MSLSLSEAQLLGNWDSWRRPSEIRWLILSVGIALFVVATFDVIIGLLHNLQAFAFLYRGRRSKAQELADISGWINVPEYTGGLFVASPAYPIDVALTRCYIVYSAVGKVLIPSLILYFGGFAIAIKLVEAQASLNYAKTTVTSSDIRPWSETFFCITAVQNTLTTGLLIWRHMAGLNARLRNFVPVQAERETIIPHSAKSSAVIAESGFAYTLMVFLTFLVDLCNTNLVYCFADLTHQATGIAFIMSSLCEPLPVVMNSSLFCSQGPQRSRKRCSESSAFRAHIRNYQPTSTTGELTAKSIRASFVGPHEDLPDEHQHI